MFGTGVRFVAGFFKVARGAGCENELLRQQLAVAKRRLEGKRVRASTMER
jgi:hypothetical protein